MLAETLKYERIDCLVVKEGKRAALAPEQKSERDPQRAEEEESRRKRKSEEDEEEREFKDQALNSSLSFLQPLSLSRLSGEWANQESIRLKMGGGFLVIPCALYHLVHSTIQQR